MAWKELGELGGLCCQSGAEIVFDVLIICKMFAFVKFEAVTSLNF